MSVRAICAAMPICKFVPACHNGDNRRAGKQTKVVTPTMLRSMSRFASRTPFPAPDRAMILLWVKAGLRAWEIAPLEVLDAPKPRSGGFHLMKGNG